MAAKKRLIIPDELIAEIEILYQNHYVCSHDKTIHDIFNAVRRRIRRCTKVYAVEVVHGRWVYEPVEFDWKKDIKCSICGEYVNTTSNYCPNCGAKMDGGVV